MLNLLLAKLSARVTDGGGGGGGGGGGCLSWHVNP